MTLTLTETAPSLHACPACDCLFVAPAVEGAARCPICKSARSRPGSEWIALRRARRDPEAPARLAAEAERPSFGGLAPAEGAPRWGE